jgi:hypothetical protein
MAKKKLKICITLFLNNDTGVFNGVNEFKPDSAVDLLGNLRKCLNSIYGFPVDDQEPKGFQNLTINSFKSVDVDVEETQ